jgi:tRNA-dihydrouridine synthase B
VSDLAKCLTGDAPVLALAPMQDVTDWAFWKLMTAYGGADLYFTEYFRVTEVSRLDKPILRSITENPTGRPAIAQMIGNDISSLVRTAKELQRHPIAAIDLNLGCPAPIVYRKCAGGGLLRDPARVDRILGALREAITIPFTVKTRIGFDSGEGFDDLLAIFARHSLDLLTVHGRTVLEMYRPGVHYDFITRAVQEMSCPVMANGGIDSATAALQVREETGARGLMIGRGAIRNPWIFRQIRAATRGEAPVEPSGGDVLQYVRDLYVATQPEGIEEKLHVQKMKKYMNFLGAGVGPDFLHDIRRVNTQAEFFGVCEAWLDHSRAMSLVDANG